MELIAKLVGKLVCKPAIRDRLIAIAERDPDDHIMSPDGTKVYMYRFWLFNKIDKDTWRRKYNWIPFSLRIHRIVMPDLDRHLHDHPANARTWILKGGYDEVREYPITWPSDDAALLEYRRFVGETTTLGFEQYHKIVKLHGGEAVTLFMFGNWIGSWGFKVHGRKVLRAEYERMFKQEHACKARQHSDQMACEPCELAWDANDPYPPKCGQEK